MPSIIPNLWPNDIEVDVVPPVTILRAQASHLGPLTRGILEAEVTTVTANGDRLAHRLDLIAPALGDYRRTILTLTHNRDMFYPVTLEAECFRPKSKGLLGTPLSEVLTGEWRPLVATQNELIDRTRQVLQSVEVRSLIQSLIARSKEQQPEGADTGDAAR